MISADASPGVYLLAQDAEPRLVHAFQGGDYGIEEISEHFGLGSVVEDDAARRIEISLAARELRELKVNADAYSFDFEQEFIEMCLEMSRAGLAAGCDPCRFVGNF